MLTVQHLEIHENEMCNCIRSIPTLVGDDDMPGMLGASIEFVDNHIAGTIARSTRTVHNIPNRNLSKILFALAYETLPEI